MARRYFDRDADTIITLWLERLRAAGRKHAVASDVIRHMDSLAGGKGPKRGERQ